MIFQRIVRKRIFVLPRERIVWIAIPKSGCTAITQLLAEATCYDPHASEASPLAERSRALLIHDRKVNLIPRLENLPARIRKDAIHSPDWWRFTVVRDPFARFFSAWSDKILLRAPGTKHLWHVSEDILQDGNLNLSATFRRFVRTIEAKPEAVMSDWHFTPQKLLMYSDLFQGVEVVPLSRLGELQQRLSEKIGRILSLKRSNESLPLDYRKFYDKDSLTSVAGIYASDTNCDPAVPTPTPFEGEDVVLNSLETDLIYKMREASERISNLSKLVVFPRLLAPLRRFFSGVVHTHGQI